MKSIDDYQIGDTVTMMMTGVMVEFVGKCVSTKEKPEPKTPAYDHPRFEIIGMMEGGTQVGIPPGYENTILKPGDYIIMGECKDGTP